MILDIVLYAGVLIIWLKWAILMCKVSKMNKVERESFFDEFMMKTCITGVCFAAMLVLVFILIAISKVVG